MNKAIETATTVPQLEFGNPTLLAKGKLENARNLHHSGRLVVLTAGEITVLASFKSSLANWFKVTPLIQRRFSLWPLPTATARCQILNPPEALSQCVPTSLGRRQLPQHPAATVAAITISLSPTQIWLAGNREGLLSMPWKTYGTSPQPTDPRPQLLVPKALVTLACPRDREKVTSGSHSSTKSANSVTSPSTNCTCSTGPWEGPLCVPKPQSHSFQCHRPKYHLCSSEEPRKCPMAPELSVFIPTVLGRSP